jgi:DnaJ-class molecular chaperone
MPHLRYGVRGNLHAHIEVLVPTRLDGTDTELLRKLKEAPVAGRRRGEVQQRIRIGRRRRAVQPAAGDLLGR